MRTLSVIDSEKVGKLTISLPKGPGAGKKGSEGPLDMEWCVHKASRALQPHVFTHLLASSYD